MYSQLLHSHLLQSLGNAIVHSLWQSLVLLLIYKAFISLKKDLQPAVKHNLSATFVILTFGWFVFTFQKKYFLSDALVNEVSGSIYQTSPPSFSLINIPTEISAALSIAYLVLLAFLMTRLFFAIGRTLRIHTSSLSPVDEAIAAFTKHASTLLKIKRKVTVWIGNNISVPATIGFFKPIILLPAVCLTQLTPQQIEAIILHELSHIRRNDFFLNLVLVVIETILFFNPAVFIFMKTIREERENCCDDLVLSNNYEPLHYAKALLTFSREQVMNQKLAMNAASRKHQLLYRIKRITGGDLERQVHFSGRILVFAFIAILFFSFSVFTNHHPGKPGSPDFVVVKNIPSTAGKEILSNSATKSQENPPATKKFTTDSHEETIAKEAPTPFDLVPHLEDISKEIQLSVGKPLEPLNPSNEKIFSDLIEKEANVQVQQTMKQFSEKKLAELFQQKQLIFQNWQLEKEMAYLDQFRKNTGRQLERVMITADSITLHSKIINNKLKEIILQGKKVMESNGDHRIIISPDDNNPVRLKIEKRLRTADI